MNVIVVLLPVALFLGALGLIGFLWAVRSGQFDDLEGAAQRILIDDDVEDPQDTDESDRAGEGEPRSGHER